MKSWNFKYILLTGILLVCFSELTTAQNSYDRRIDKYHSHWSKLIPSHQKIQFAGGMGLISLGVGWDYGKNDQWETDIFFGYLPKYSTAHGKLTFTLKQNFIPWEKRLNKSFSLEPLACGLYVNTIFDEEFWIHEPEKYPRGYYSFSTRMRFNAYIGQRITFHIPLEKRFISKQITAFYEISSNDLYIVSAVGNSALKPSDYLRLSFGLKFQLF